MQIVKQSWKFDGEVDGIELLRRIERAGRLCYKLEGRIGPELNIKFIEGMLKKGHLSVIEHANISVVIITDRGVTHELVRHRIASYTQESTRYCNYSDERFGTEIQVILPVEFYDNVSYLHQLFADWRYAMQAAETFYLSMIENKAAPQLARAVLPNSLKTEIMMTCNIREWRHFFTLRCSLAAHPQMRALALDMLSGFKEKVPLIFDDLYPTIENVDKLT